MKNFKYVLLALVAVVIIVVVVKGNKTPPAGAPVDVARNSPVVPQQLCYIWNTEAGDKATISMNTVDNQVTGTFNWLPAEKDSKTGTFTGRVSASQGANQTIDAVWTASGEGVTNKEELRILIEGDIAKPGFGEMKLGADGVYAYADPSAISYVPSLQRTDCGDNAMN